MDLINKVYEAVDKRQGEDIVVLDFKENSPFLDYFLVCSARNTRHAFSIIDEIEELAEKENISVKSKSNNKESGWLLIDIGSVIVHVFVGEERARYNLEGLWRDLIVKL